MYFASCIMKTWKCCVLLYIYVHIRNIRKIWFCYTSPRMADFFLRIKESTIWWYWWWQIRHGSFESKIKEKVIESETKGDNEESISSKSEEGEATGSSATNGMKPKAKVKGKKQICHGTYRNKVVLMRCHNNWLKLGILVLTRHRYNCVLNCFVMMNFAVSCGSIKGNEVVVTSKGKRRRVYESIVAVRFGIFELGNWVAKLIYAKWRHTSSY